MNNMLIIGGADGLTERFIAGKLGISWLNVLGLILVERSYDASLSADSVWYHFWRESYLCDNEESCEIKKIRCEITRELLANNDF